MSLAFLYLDKLLRLHTGKREGRAHWQIKYTLPPKTFKRATFPGQEGPHLGKDCRAVVTTRGHVNEMGTVLASAHPELSSMCRVPSVAASLIQTRAYYLTYEKHSGKHNINNTSCCH